MLLTFALAMVACNTTDDIEAIFSGQTWYLTYIKNGDEKTTPKNGKIYSIDFNKNAQFEARVPGGGVIKGRWHADGSDKHSFNCTNVTYEGFISGDSIANNMLNILQNATSYNGDTNWLHIIKDKNTEMQFYNLN